MTPAEEVRKSGPAGGSCGSRDQYCIRRNRG